MSNPYRFDFGYETLELALCADMSADAHEDFLLKALEVLIQDGGCKLDISLLKYHVEELTKIRLRAHDVFLEKARATVTRVHGEDGFKAIQRNAFMALQQFYPRICTPDEREATLASALGGGGSSGGSDAVQAAQAAGEAGEAVSAAAPLLTAGEPRANDEPEEFDGNEHNTAETESNLPASSSPRTRDCDSRVPTPEPRTNEESQGSEADGNEDETVAAHSSSSVVQRAPPVLTPAVSTGSELASSAVAPIIDIASEALMISRLVFEEGGVVPLETSLNYVIDAALTSIFDNSKPQQLDDIPKLVELVIDCLCGLMSSAEHLKASYENHGKALSSVASISSASKLTAVLELINELDATSSEGEQHDSEKLAALKDAIKRLDSSKASKRTGEVTNARVEDFLKFDRATRRRLEALVSIGMMHYLLSNCTLSQIFKGLKVEKKALDNIQDLAEELDPKVPLDSNIMSGLDALTKIVLPSLSSQVDKIRLDAVHAVVDIVSSVDLVQGKEKASRTRFWLDETDGLWRRLQFLGSRRSASGAVKDPVSDLTVEGYFVDTPNADNGERTFADRRDRLKVIFMVFVLLGPINRRDPEWAFVSPGNGIRNVLTLGAHEVVKFLKIRVSKEYFANDWKDKFAKSIQSKRQVPEEKAARGAKEYGEVVRRNVVIDEDRQLKSLKELYALYAP